MSLVVLSIERERRAFYKECHKIELFYLREIGKTKIFEYQIMLLWKSFSQSFLNFWNF